MTSGRERANQLVERAAELLEDLRQRITAIDIAVRVHERDKNAAGTLLGSALALRLFLFFIPLLLFSVGVAGSWADIPGSTPFPLKPA
ncbi:MAG: hypothetical protein OEZ14_08580 [Acidimicrobiia bacterium]|nr:hypothetical protein [Acidimicrobiia bacterium]